MISKILVFALVIAAIYYFFFRKKSTEKAESKDEEVMVECSKCSVYITKKEAIIKEGKYFCSKECAGI